MNLSCQQPTFIHLRNRLALSQFMTKSCISSISDNWFRRQNTNYSHLIPHLSLCCAPPCPYVNTKEWIHSVTTIYTNLWVISRVFWCPFFFCFSFLKVCFWLINEDELSTAHTHTQYKRGLHLWAHQPEIGINSNGNLIWFRCSSSYAFVCRVLMLQTTLNRNVSSKCRGQIQNVFERSKMPQRH